MSEREQVEAALNAIDDLRDWLKDEVVIAHYADSEKLRNRIIQMLDQYERRIKAMDSDSLSGTFSCPICGKDSPHEHTSQEVAEHQVSASRLPAPVSQPVEAGRDGHKPDCAYLRGGYCFCPPPSPQAEPSESAGLPNRLCGTCGQVHREGTYYNHNFVQIAPQPSTLPQSQGLYTASQALEIIREKFQKDEDQGYRSRSRQFALDILSKTVSTLPQSSPQAQGFEECWKETEKSLKKQGFGGLARLNYRRVAQTFWTAAQSQPVAEKKSGGDDN